MTRATRSYLVWGSWLAAFAALELSALRAHSSWLTLSSTVWSLEERWPVTRVLADAGLTLLRRHVVRRTIA